MYDLPKNRFYISRSIFSATRHDYAAVIACLQSDLEHLTRKKYDLSITFKRASDPTAPEGTPPILGTVKSTHAITRRLWNAADEIEARLSPRTDTPGQPVPHVDFALVTNNKLLDSRQIRIEVQPKTHGQEISRFFFDNHFRLWPRGYDFS
jgi:hypothetical protein